jgi:hypothetical protein
VIFFRFVYFQPITELSQSTAQELAKWPVVLHGRQHFYKKMALMILGYYNTTLRFADHVRDFDEAVSRLAFAPDSAVEESNAPTSAPPVTAASASAPVSSAVPAAAAPSH